jgi:uncharacterized protein (DUF2141 family)
MLSVSSYLFAAVLNITFTGIYEPKGSIYVAVFDRKDSFLDTEKVCAKRIVPLSAGGALALSLADLPPGTYAISCFHDLNGNGRLDKNWAGIPTEPYGFSNNARPKFRAPTWDESKITLPATGSSISIRLAKW